MRDLREFHDPRLHLPICGEDIIIESPTADEGLRIKRHMYAGGSTPQDEMRMIAMLFHATYNEDTDTMSGACGTDSTAWACPSTRSSTSATPPSHTSGCPQSSANSGGRTAWEKRTSR